jgi:hypothetical protein
MIIRVDPDIIIPQSDVHLGKIPGVMQSSNQCERERERIRVPYRPIVDVPIVLTGAKFSTLLANKEEPACLGRFQLRDKTFLLILINKCLDR